EATGFTISVDGSLHGAQKSGLMLHLIEGDGLFTAEERLWVAPRQIEHVEIVERSIVPLARHETLCKSALTGLPSPGDYHGRHDLEALRQRGSNDSGQGHHVTDDNHSRGE